MAWVCCASADFADPASSDVSQAAKASTPAKDSGVGFEAARLADARTLAVEIDVGSTIHFDPKTLELVADSFSEINITLSFEISTVEISEKPLISSNAKSKVLRSTRGNPQALHVVIAKRGAGAHGIVHYRNGDHNGSDLGGRAKKITKSNADVLAETGVIVFAETISSEFAANPLLKQAGLDMRQLFARSLAHEIGHALGCPHRQDSSSTTLMVQNSALGPVTARNLASWTRALAGTRGYPQFALSAQHCMDLERVLSIQARRPNYADTIAK